jgi:mannose-6-phosphate isomerase-like protein (cupin superfamily)
MNRREVLGAISAVMLLAQAGGAETPDTPVLTESELFKFGAASETFNAAGGGTRQTMPRTTLPSGEVVGVHVGTIPAGKVYSAMHANGNAEFLIVHEGKMEFLTDANPPKLAEAGDVIYAAAHEGHSLRNPGDVKTTYFVVAVGGPKPKPTT